MLKDKYKELFAYGETLGIKEIASNEEKGKLHIKGLAPYQAEKNMFWDKIKTFEKWKEEIAADIRVENADIYGFYTVQPGDTLSQIAKEHLGDAMKYMDIFKLNNDILKDPNMIK